MIYIDDKKDFLDIPRTYNGGDMSNYPTREETQQMIDESIGELDIPTKVSELENDSKFVTEEQLDEAVSEKADKSYVEDELAGKADKDNTYTKDEVNSLIPDVSDLATKTEVTEGLATKQDTLQSGKNIKTLNGQSVLGEGNVEIQAGGGNASLDIAALAVNCTFKNDKVGEKVVVGCGTDDVSILIRANGTQGPKMTQTIVPTKSYADGKYQAKENGKGLSTNDFTDEEKEKLAELPDDVATVSFPSNTEKAIISSDKTSQRVEMDFQSDEVEIKKVVAGGATTTKHLATKEYVNESKGIFVLDIANMCSYNELQAAIDAPKVVFIKVVFNFYLLQDKYDTNEGTKRYVNISTMQRQDVEKGVTNFVFEADRNDLDAPMIFISRSIYPTGKPYTDYVVGNLSSLTTSSKRNIVEALNEVNSKVGMNLEVGVEKWYGTYTEDGVTYQVYTKTIKIDALPATAGITNYPHGITGIKQILSAYGFGTNGFVLNAPRRTTQDIISIYQVQKGSATSEGNIAIEVGKDRSNMGAYIVLIYAKNN